VNTLIYGTRNQGKSTLAVALAVAEHDRILIFDPRGTFPIFQSFPIDALDERLRSYRGGIQITRVGPFDTDEVTDAFAEFTRVTREHEDISVIVDESHMLQGSNTLDPNLDRWNRESSSSVTVIQTTHRIVDAHPDSRYHADNVFFFYADGPRELKTIRENFGSDVGDAIPRLGKHQAIHWHRAVGGFKTWIVWENGEDWYIDLENNNG
jgi:hypothetical protein